MPDFTKTRISDFTDADRKLVEDWIDVQIEWLHQCEGRLLRYRNGEGNVIQTLNTIHDTRGFLDQGGDVLMEKHKVPDYPKERDFLRDDERYYPKAQ